MGKNSSPKHGKFNKSGWLSGVFHVFDFHHWRRTKNLPICWKTPRTHSLMRETEEQEPFLDSKYQDSKMLSAVADNNTTIQQTKLKKKMMSTKQVTEYVDFLEILRKEDVFVKIMKDQVQIKSNPRVLPKSGSFPLSRSSSSRPAKIEHKLKENWYASPRQNSTVLTLNVPRVTSQEHKPFKDRFREIKKVIKNVLKDRNPKKKKKKKVSDVNYVGRYSQLLEHSFRREDGELRSKSLKIDLRDNKPQFFRRISSLSSLEVLGSFLTDLPQDQDTNLRSKKPISEPPVRAEKEERYEVEEERSQENHFDIPNQQDQDSVPNTCSLEDTPQKTEEEDVYFCYVKKALEVSGNGEKWHTEEQPLNPSLLNELEIQEEEESVNNKELLFDLVNEAIVETQNQSHIYFPKTCLFEKRYLDEVWGRFKWNISGLGDENRDRSLDDIVGRDLRKTDGWMNLRGDSEWLTLEIEDLIFDDVLDDLLCVY